MSSQPALAVPRPTKALPYVALLSLFWGTNVVASRFGIGEFDPYFFIALRLGISTLFFFPFVLWRHGQWPNQPGLWWKASLSGFIGIAIPFTTFVLSLQYQSSGVASLYVTLAPVMIMVAAHFVLPDEKLSRAKLWGVALALSGALFLAVRGESGLADVGRASPLGFILVFSGISLEVVNTMFVRLRMKEYDPMEVTAIRILVGGVVVLVATVVAGDFSLAQVTRAGLLSMLYAALIGALAGQFMAFYIQRRFGATAFSLTAFIVPVVATFFGALLLGEIVTPAITVGVVLIGAGLFQLNRYT